MSIDRRIAPKDRFKLAIGRIVYPLQTLRWRAFALRHAVLGQLAPMHPRILHKIYRPFVSRHLHCAERVDLLVEHYNAMHSAGLCEFIRASVAEPALLARFTGKSGGQFELKMSAILSGHREGELGVHLFFDERILCSATIIFFGRVPHLNAMLGGLQGASGEDVLDRVRAATRELHGCRPKNLVLHAVRQFGFLLGCDKLELVSNCNRVAINWRRSRRITADYDALWREVDALPGNHGNFVVGCDIPTAMIEDVPSRKRAELKRRLALLEAMRSQLAQTLARAGGSDDNDTQATRHCLHTNPNTVYCRAEASATLT